MLHLNVRSPICTRFLLRLIPWNHFFAWIQFSFSVLKMGVTKRHHVTSPATKWIQCAIKRSHLLGHVFGPLIQLLDMYSHKKVFEELRFGQVREEGAGHTGTGYEGHNWLLQTVDTDTDHHVRKKTLHPLWMNRHKHQRKNHAQRTTQTSTSKDSIMHTAQSSFELYQWALQLKTNDLFQNTSMATQYIFMRPMWSRYCWNLELD